MKTGKEGRKHIEGFGIGKKPVRSKHGFSIKNINLKRQSARRF